MDESELFGKFKIIKCFKKDESLAVYLADHIYLGKKIILKTLNISLITDQVVLQRFKREAQLLAKINHPNIISVYDFGSYKDFFYISFEYFESRNLRQAFLKNSWNIDDKINILNQIASGLSETHHKKIIHRDLKPENILINDNNEVKIADFGLAQVSGGEKLTAAEAVVGTPAYMTPEQINGLKTDERSDLFSVGILIYEMFFGVNPFLGKDAGQTLNNIQTCRINTPPPHHGMPEYVPLIIDTLLKKNPTDRPESIDFIFNYTGKENPAHPHKKAKTSKFITVAFIIIIIAVIVIVERNFFNNSLQESTGSKILTDSTASEKIYPVDSNKIIPKTTSHQKSESKSSVIHDTILVKSAQADTLKNQSTINQNAFGFIDIKCNPWADILIDSLRIDTTPLKEPYQLTAGRHTIQLKHPDYPEYSSIVKISENDTLKVSVNLDTLVGFFICNVYPWGDIYVNDDFKEQTPLSKPILLTPGPHTLEIKNPDFKSYRRIINITKSDTLKIVVRLEKLFNTN